MKKGFTLLEMIIVVTIVSILFLLTVPNIQKVIGVVDDKGCEAQIKVVDSAILEYRLDPLLLQRTERRIYRGPGQRVYHLCRAQRLYHHWHLCRQGHFWHHGQQTPIPKDD